MQIVRYLALMSGGRELPAETDMGRIAVPLLDARVEGRWTVTDGARGVLVDGLGLAEEPDGPLVATHRSPWTTPLGSSAGDPLIWSVHLSNFAPCG